MKIIVVGTRGVPNIPGGIETHCEELYPRLCKLGCDITIIRRTPYISKENEILEFKGVKIKDIYSPKLKNLETIIHTFLSIIYCVGKSPDVVHFHGIGPALMVPLIRFAGLKVIFTNHGPDYERKKWGPMAKKVLKLGEKMGIKYSHKVIVISKLIKKNIEKKYNRNDCNVIFNGVNKIGKEIDIKYLTTLGIKPLKYILGVGRFVEEKGFHDLIAAYNQIKFQGYKLVIVGDADHESGYSKKLKSKAVESGIVLTGFIKGRELNQIFSNARLFVLPSYHEGLPIALLEAMSWGLDVLASDISANIEVGLNPDCYFCTGNVEQLGKKIIYKLSCEKSIDYHNILQKYCWEKVALQTLSVFKEALGIN